MNWSAVQKKDPIYLNLGGGIKIGLKDKLGVRVECRWWNAEDVSLISVLGGISYSF